MQTRAKVGGRGAEMETETEREMEGEMERERDAAETLGGLHSWP